MSVLSDSNHWFVCPRVNSEAEIRLFLFPYAGGGPAVFNQWISKLPGEIEAWVAHYPGRGSRHREAPIRRLTMLAEKFCQAILPLSEKPFAFFGHSLGGLVAFELARQLQQEKSLRPEILFVSASGAPHLAGSHPPTHGYSDSEFMTSLREWNGIPSELTHQPDVMQLLLPILRADFEAVESYTYHSNVSPLHVPIAAFGGSEDSHVSQERIEGWALHTDAGFQSQYFAGDHFFIKSCGEVIAALIAAKLISSYEKN